MAKRPKTDSLRAASTTVAGDLKVTIEPFGPTQIELDRLATQWLASKSFRQMVGHSRHRLLSVVTVEDGSTVKTTRIPPPSDRVRATVYDYDNNRTVFLDGSLKAPNEVDISELALQPQPSTEEFQEAVALLEKDQEFGATLREGGLRTYAPMPPLVQVETPTGRIERTIAVGLLPAEGRRRQGHEIVGVNLVRQTVEHFSDGAPPGSQANSRSICGAPVGANQPTASHIAGQVRITVRQGAKTLWRLLAVRPAASSGTNGSGVELRYVDYRGKRLLYRAHVPILNVKYDGNACGPYRDWQYQEGQIQAVGTDVAPGFRLCTAPATTILDTGSDTGNYLGVGIFVEGQEVVLVSEMEAGWYRYLSSWRLHSDGSIKPRFGFAAVDNSCVCNRHHHHVYWRPVEQLADGVPQAVDGALGGLAQEGLELGEGLLDRVEIGRVGRQVTQLGAARLDRRADADDFVRGEVVHHYDVALHQHWCQHLLDPGEEDRAVHGTVEDVGGDEAARGQPTDEGRALPMAVRDRAVQALAARAAAVASRHVGGGAGLVH